ncbi:hypothetical protein PS712_06009 [Pseudomonas fluorescens]|uniref:Uncharacterized protein n=1 Tax=Pseudomonas fluorescens TaxID=294 RepID=A0A5E7FS96_PSEFL|nr:hypothetical protein PS712_06009 [Pseudomonas fluorescens]
MWGLLLLWKQVAQCQSVKVLEYRKKLWELAC